MARGPLAFKQADVERLARAVVKSGLQLHSVEVHVGDARLVAKLNGKPDEPTTDERGNEWDGV